MAEGEVMAMGIADGAVAIGGEAAGPAVRGPELDIPKARGAWWIVAGQVGQFEGSSNWQVGGWEREQIGG
jgi:hypothetical protein